MLSLDKPSRCFKTVNDQTFAIWGLAMHLLLLWGILDVNFHSPIIQGLSSVPGPSDPPAKRLVLFVADGLRYRTFMDSPPKYLKDVMSKDGVWGVSHTRMPTESRPGVVAICAGLYEDPSALFKGWKENPVDFDSIFNQSNHAWAWGSPDIVPIFTKGSAGNVHGESYPHEWEDFDLIKGEIWRLDSWVFDKYENWLRTEAGKAKDQDGIVLFLHLLGCDTTGHTAKPYSRAYTDNMNYVDQRIKEVVAITEDTFKDGRTAYVFTADHGMTDWGSHGSGSTDETEVPLIVWGAGANKYNSRYDVEQVDITPLISSLIGIPIPVNNEGVLPLHYLHTDHHEYGSRALLNNVKQLTYQVKANRANNCGENNNGADWREVELDQRISDVENYIKAGNRDSAIMKSENALNLAKQSLSYFRQYQRLRFLIYLSLMWLGWIVVLFFKIAGTSRPRVNTSLLFMTNALFVCFLFIVFIKYAVSNCKNVRLPYYTTLAAISLWLAARAAILHRPDMKLRNCKRTWIEIAGTIFLLTAMFAGLTYRSALSVGMLCIAGIQIFFKPGQVMLFCTALCLAVFPLLPVVEPYPRVYVVLAGILVAIALITWRLPKGPVKIIEVIRLVVTGLVYAGLIDGRSWVSWFILLSTPVCICSCPARTKERILAIALALFSPLTLLSASYEPFFFLTLTAHLLCWPGTQTSVEEAHGKGSLTTEELLNAAFFMLYTLLCFFGTGNMASISSFDPSWTRHFVTVFSPFVMFSLILFKISIPLILVGCKSHTFRSETVFLAVLFLGDCLSLPLMFCVTPRGSWLDIGSAISKFTIAVTLPCLLLLLYYLSYPLMSFNTWKFWNRVIPEKKHVV